jgi:hypothetical protein
MTNFQSWGYGGSAFDLPDHDFLALIGAFEWNEPMDMTTYSYTSFEDNAQFLDTIDPISFSDHLGAPGAPNDTTESMEFSDGRVSESPINHSQYAERLYSPGISLSQNEELPVSPVDSAERSLEDHLFEFEVPEPNKRDKRRRKPYSHKRRKEVGQVRRAGACMRCRITKTPVTLYARRSCT